ncbi:Neuroendocrine convertase 2 [Tupaia chinensis]|uniref:Proprotein convertase 2 n=1 Tax=Tupaia chinensis TaxID=246437 RepID=L9L447_TUPCH|nr:Neuroendocrine convertase 2 [Tupaia chinensis]
MKGGCGSQWKVASGLLFCVMVFASAERPVFTNHFLVELHKGGEEEARQVAAEHGFGVRKGSLVSLQDLVPAGVEREFGKKLGLGKSEGQRVVIWLPEDWEVKGSRSKPEAEDPSKPLAPYEILNRLSPCLLPTSVKMALQQEGFDRKKRGYRDINEIDINMNDPLFTKQWYLVKMALQQEGFDRKKRGYRDINEIDINMNDPLFTKQWYLINTGQADGTPGLDLNVAEAWELGYTGKGVTIGIMDDGIDYLHPDLASNYGSVDSSEVLPVLKLKRALELSHGVHTGAPGAGGHHDERATAGDGTVLSPE